jgi:cullin-associated NEDD8-dissociated protein 1
VVLRCPREVTAHLDRIIHVSLGFMKYDPNYTYDESDEEADADGEQDEEEEYDDEDFGGSDDDDTSWKVRRSALKVLSAVITSRPELLQEIYRTCGDELIARFKEREENVRLDVISCFTCLLKATLALEGRVKTRSFGGAGGREDAIGRMLSAGLASEQEQAAVIRQSAVIELLQERVRAIVRAADKQLKGNSQRTKSAMLNMLKSLANVVKGGLAPHLEVIMLDVKRCVGDKSQGLKLDALSLIHTLLETHEPPVVHPFLPSLVPLVTTCVTDDWYKIIAEALRVVGVIIRIIRPIDTSSGMFQGDLDSGRYVEALHQAIFPRLNSHDIDQEIKECAITSVGLLVRHLSDQLPTQVPQILALLMDKLRNEITRMPTLKALALIATSPLSVDLSPILASAVSELSQFLRQQSRPLKLTTLETLLALVQSNSGRMTPDLFELVLRETTNLISDADLHLSHLALQLTICIISVSPASATSVASYSKPNILRLAGSPLLQGHALRSLLDLLGCLVQTGAPGVTFHELIRDLEEIAHEQQGGAGGGGISKQVISNLAVSMARISAHSSDKDRSAFIARLVDNMRSGHGNDLKRHLSLLCIGELGAQRDLSSIPNLQAIILESFDSGNEETKTAAAYALGKPRS